MFQSKARKEYDKVQSDAIAAGYPNLPDGDFMYWYCKINKAWCAVLTEVGEATRQADGSWLIHNTGGIINADGSIDE